MREQNLAVGFLLAAGLLALISLAVYGLQPCGEGYVKVRDAFGGFACVQGYRP